jgi:hypothetical protein
MQKRFIYLLVLLVLSTSLVYAPAPIAEGGGGSNPKLDFNADTKPEVLNNANNQQALENAISSGNIQITDVRINADTQDRLLKSESLGDAQKKLY